MNDSTLMDIVSKSASYDLNDIICLILGGQSRSIHIRLNGIKVEGASIIKIMVIPPNNVEVSTT